jgi:hypothetical protein
MTRFTPPPAPSEVEAFIGQVVTDLSAAFSGVLVNVGCKLGLYQAMADLGTCTSTALAEATGIRERYIREWLANQAAGGYVAYDPEKQTYALPPAQAMVLALDVWSGRASQENFVKLAVAVLHQCIRPLIGACCAPGHHGYQRVCDLISGKASSGQMCHQYSQAPGRPNLHLVSFSRRPR